MKHYQELITALHNLNIKITGSDIPEILQFGVDTFLLRRGEHAQQEELDTIYLIISEIRESASLSCTPKINDFERFHRIL